MPARRCAPAGHRLFLENPPQKKIIVNNLLGVIHAAAAAATLRAELVTNVIRFWILKKRPYTIIYFIDFTLLVFFFFFVDILYCHRNLHHRLTCVFVHQRWPPPPGIRLFLFRPLWCASLTRRSVGLDRRVAKIEPVDYFRTLFALCPGCVFGRATCARHSGIVIVVCPPVPSKV